MKASVYFLLLLVASFVVCALSFRQTQWFQLDDYSFDDYVREYSKSYSSQEHEMRRRLFEEKLSSIQAHNKLSTNTWKKGINRLSDATPEEFRRLLGYDKFLGHTAWLARNQQTDKQPRSHQVSLSELPENVDWRNKSVLTAVKDQGQCGSCWAFGTVESIESYWALATGKLQDLSEQQILDCTPNTGECGGTGGCGGGIAELGFQYVAQMGGIDTEWYYPYVSWSGNNFPNCTYSASESAASLKGWNNVDSNQYDEVMNALANVGPLAINVDASAWDDYETGVFGGCNMTSPDINHVVQLAGYGTDRKLGDYWIVRNSWTAGWGEDGYIRIARSSKAPCGNDTTPLDGTGCRGGPTSVQVCGECGILFDALYPIVE